MGGIGGKSIRDKTAGDVIGSTRFYSYDASGGAVRLGYKALSPGYWGSGANQETREVPLEYAFTIVEKVYFDIGEENFRSRKAVEKLDEVECAGDDEKVVYCLSKNAFSTRALGGWQCS